MFGTLMKPFNFNFVIVIFIFSASSFGFSNFRFRSLRHQHIKSSSSLCEVTELCGDWKDIRPTFVEKYWNKKPLLVRGAFPRMITGDRLLSKKDLIRVSQSNELSSRLIKNAYNIQYGPFTDEDFNKVNDNNDDDDDIQWSLLVNDMERVIPEIHEIAEAFDCIPTCFHDDIMVSCGSRDGTIGAHVDSYDVFLIQSCATRIWELDLIPLLNDKDCIMNDGRDARVLRKDCFNATCTWELNSGDMLYLPPNIPHRGTSTSADAMTISVGFRLPKIKDAILDFSEHMSRHHNDDSLRIPNFVIPCKQDGLLDSGNIDNDTISHVRNTMRKTLLSFLEKGTGGKNTNHRFERWFGMFSTTPERLKSYISHHNRTHLFTSIACDALSNMKEGKKCELKRQLGIKCCYIQTDITDMKGYMFIDGQEFEYNGDLEERFVREICTRSLHRERIATLDTTSDLLVTDHFHRLLGRLLDCGFLYTS